MACSASSKGQKTKGQIPQDLVTSVNREISLPSVIARFGARDQLWMRNLNPNLVPFAPRAVGGSSIRNCVKGAHVGSHLSIESGHVVEPIDFIQAAASADRKSLQPRTRRGVYACNGRTRDGQSLWISRRQCQRIDSHALTIGSRKYRVQLCTRLWFDCCQCLFIRLRFGNCIAVGFSQLRVEAVSKHHDSFASLAFFLQFIQSILQRCVEMCFTCALGDLNGISRFFPISRKTGQRLYLCIELNHSDAVFRPERVEKPLAC